MRNHRAGRIAKADTAAANGLIKERVEKVYPPNITRAMIAYPPSPGASLGSVNRQTITHNARMNVSTENTKAVFRTGLIVIRRPCSVRIYKPRPCQCNGVPHVRSARREGSRGAAPFPSAALLFQCSSILLPANTARKSGSRGGQRHRRRRTAYCGPACKVVWGAGSAMIPPTRESFTVYSTALSRFTVEDFGKGEKSYFCRPRNSSRLTPNVGLTPFLSRPWKFPRWRQE